MEPLTLIKLDELELRRRKVTHFKVMQKILNQHYPQAPIIGLFVALSIYANY